MIDGDWSFVWLDRLGRGTWYGRWWVGLVVGLVVGRFGGLNTL